ncbi:MAG: amidohydrolase family protein [Alphaproteobacteria bacterium]|nr:amidohydrolase family protein [Alphaproteobacteria bacterium]
MKLGEKTSPYRLSGCMGTDGQCTTYEIGADGVVLASTPAGPAPMDPPSLITPGLVDIQVNGFAGIDFNAPGLTAKTLDLALSAMLATGVTKCLPTLITAGERQLLSLLGDLDQAVTESRLGPLMVPGYHIEGPFLSPLEGYSGAHPAHQMRSGSLEVVQKLQAVATRPIRIMTVAPEVDGVVELIPDLVSHNITVAIGHTAATRAQIDLAIEAGATLSTHLGNGVPHLLNKNENSLHVQLGRDQLTASFIADGIHIPPDMLQSWLRAKTLDRSILVTDASAPAGAPGTGGIFTIGDQEIERLADGSVRIPGSSYLAGSGAAMDAMVRNVMAWFGLSVSDILRLARTNPLAAIGLPVDGPTVNQPAEFVEWRWRDARLFVHGAHVGHHYLQTGAASA